MFGLQPDEEHRRGLLDRCVQFHECSKSDPQEAHRWEVLPETAGLASESLPALQPAPLHASTPALLAMALSELGLEAASAFGTVRHAFHK